MGVIAIHFAIGVRSSHFRFGSRSRHQVSIQKLLSEDVTPNSNLKCEDLTPFRSCGRGERIRTAGRL